MPEERKVYRRPARTAAPAPQAGQTAPRPDAPPPPKKKKRPGAKRRRSRLVLGLCLLCLLVVVVVSVVLVRCSAEEKGPAEADFGTPAAAWQKNDLGYYFNTSGRAMPAAVLKGMDVSKFQGEIDWEKAKAAGIDFAIIRCGFGGEWDGQEENWAQDDPQWRRNADECTRLGIPFGAYLYSYATTVEEARSEADHVARLLGLTAPPQEGLDDYTAAPYRLSYPVYYDLEDKYISGVFPSEMAEITQAFFDRLTEYGYTGAQGLYASRNWVRARMTDPAFDKWRDNLWIARFSDDLDYAGTYDMWQCTFSAPGADYGVQSETVDLDFVMRPFKFTGVSACNGKTAAPVLLNDTYTDELHMDGKDAYATLVTNEPGEKDGGRRVYWTTSDKTVATVDKNGTVRARTDSGECTITATLADGTESLTCRVRVGDITVPIFATAGLRGDRATLADAAALKGATPDSILLDAGDSLHGTESASLTGRDHIPPRLFKEAVHLNRMKEQIMAILNDTNPFNKKTKAEELAALLDKYIPGAEAMRTKLRKYDAAYRELTAENAALEKQLGAASKESVLKKLEINEKLRELDELHRMVDVLPPEILQAAKQVAAHKPQER